MRWVKRGVEALLTVTGLVALVLGALDRLPEAIGPWLWVVVGVALAGTPVWVQLAKWGKSWWRESAPVSRSQVRIEQLEHELTRERAGRLETELRRHAEERETELQQKSSERIKRLERIVSEMRTRFGLHAQLGELQEQGQNVLAALQTAQQAGGGLGPDPMRTTATHPRQELSDWSFRIERAFAEAGAHQEAAYFRTTATEIRLIDTYEHLIAAYRDRLSLLDGLLRPNHSLWNVGPEGSGPWSV